LPTVTLLRSSNIPPPVVSLRLAHLDQHVLFGVQPRGDYDAAGCRLTRFVEQIVTPDD
jgi:hypothetical protein